MGHCLSYDQKIPYIGNMSFGTIFLRVFIFILLIIAGWYVLVFMLRVAGWLVHAAAIALVIAGVIYLFQKIRGR